VLREIDPLAVFVPDSSEADDADAKYETDTLSEEGVPTKNPCR